MYLISFHVLVVVQGRKCSTREHGRMARGGKFVRKLQYMSMMNVEPVGVHFGTILVGKRVEVFNFSYGCFNSKNTSL